MCKTLKLSLLGHSVCLPRRDRRVLAQDPGQVPKLQGGHHDRGTAGQAVASGAH